MSRYRFPGQGLYRDFLLITQMLSPIVLVIGLFRLVAWLGLVGSVDSLVLVYAGFNIAFLSAYPVWSTIVIATDVLVIYALTVHGREVKLN